MYNHEHCLICLPDLFNVVVIVKHHQYSCKTFSFRLVRCLLCHSEAWSFLLLKIKGMIYTGTNASRVAITTVHVCYCLCIIIMFSQEEENVDAWGQDSLNPPLQIVRFQLIFNWNPTQKTILDSRHPFWNLVVSWRRSLSVPCQASDTSTLESCHLWDTRTLGLGH